jgi:hypothetical protein
VESLAPSTLSMRDIIFWAPNLADVRAAGAQGARGVYLLSDRS